MSNRLLFWLGLLVLSSGCTAAGPAADRASQDLEWSVCGLQEPLLFWLWSHLAGSPDAGRLAGLRHVEDIRFETADRRILRGYKLGATSRDGQPVAARGYLLVMQGNAILADQIIGEFSAYAANGLDVYMYDFRGYGRSGGKRRLKAIISDYLEIRKALESDYAEGYIYAMSFGGIALLNGRSLTGAPARLVVDSTPARLSGHGCPPEYDPVSHLPADCRHCLFIVGERDSVVTPSMSRELVDVAVQHGATVLRDDMFAHPFMDAEPSVHRRRLRLVEDYLLHNRKP